MLCPHTRKRQYKASLRADGVRAALGCTRRSLMPLCATCYHRKLNPTAQIIVLDAGGQYCHLIARKVRDLGVYAEVRASETPAAELSSAKGLIISGGPSSVYDPQSPTVCLLYTSDAADE